MHQREKIVSRCLELLPDLRDFGMIALSVKITFLKKIYYISFFLNIFLSEDYRDTFHFLLLTNMNLLNLTSKVCPWIFDHREICACAIGSEFAGLTPPHSLSLQLTCLGSVCQRLLRCEEGKRQHTRLFTNSVHYTSSVKKYFSLIFLNVDVKIPLGFRTPFFFK